MAVRVLEGLEEVHTWVGQIIVGVLSGHELAVVTLLPIAAILCIDGVGLAVVEKLVVLITLGCVIIASWRVCLPSARVAEDNPDGGPLVGLGY